MLLSGMLFEESQCEKDKTEILRIKIKNRKEVKESETFI